MYLLAEQFGGSGKPWQAVVKTFTDLFDGRVTSTDCAVWAAILLGVVCGVLGCFLVLKRQSLLGDAIGHAVLPGVCMGFLVAGGKNTPVLLLGALLAGLLATWLIGLLERTTRLKSAECMGVVFTGFYGLGIVLLIRARAAMGSSAGLERFLFGQIAGISLQDVTYIAVVSAVTLLAVWVMWRKLAVWAFDEAFAFSIGMNTKWIGYAMTLLLTMTVVIAIQAVGVILVAALLVTPAATAYLLTDRLHRMVLIAALCGPIAGIMGVFSSIALSSAKRVMPLGAMIVLCAAGLFAMAFLLAPRHGVLPRFVRLWKRRQKTQAENLLKTLFGIHEKRQGGDLRFGLTDVAAARQESRGQVERLAQRARQHGWLTHARDPIVLTLAGMERAKGVVRNHRLWELFLTQEAKLAQDHVHADAEHIEHFLPADVLAHLEQLLNHPEADPHGRAIPSPGNVIDTSRVGAGVEPLISAQENSGQGGKL